MNGVIATTLPLQGKTLKSVIVHKDGSNHHIIFETMCGRIFKMYHEKDCCELVYIEDIVGDLDDLLGMPLLVAEETTNSYRTDYDSNPCGDSVTWTFYKFRTNRGTVTVRWYGASNGYYSEAVWLVDITKGTHNV